jgi:DNA polymerase-4
MSRTILHIDLNNFYASVECLYRPELRNKPLIVCGDAQARHGIVLAKNYPAKTMGVKTGEAIWQAKQKCSGLVAIQADFKKYLRFSRMALAIYADYTDRIEPFGIDEAWLDISGTGKIFGTGLDIANQIRQRLQNELGLTGSVGVSWNKIFAKLGSDMKKPNATTVITKENFNQIVWPLPVGELLYVGRSTRRKLQNRAIYSIGDLANRDSSDLRLLLGVWGETLWHFANGLDSAVVRQAGEESLIKSVGNSTTTPRDLMNNQDVKLIIFVLAESVAARLRKYGLKCRTISISMRSSDLSSFERQGKLSKPTFLSGDIAKKAMELFIENYRWDNSIRSLGVRGTDLVTADSNIQLDLFDNSQVDAQILEITVDNLRKRFGHYSIQRCSMLLDSPLTGFNPKEDHVIYPVSYFK